MTIFIRSVHVLSQYRMPKATGEENEHYGIIFHKANLVEHSTIYYDIIFTDIQILITISVSEEESRNALFFCA